MSLPKTSLWVLDFEAGGLKNSSYHIEESGAIVKSGVQSIKQHLDSVALV
jgi:hypothetical protein